MKDMLCELVLVSVADPGGSYGSQGPLGHGGRVINPPVSLANITVKEHVYRPTSEHIYLRSPLRSR